MDETIWRIIDQNEDGESLIVGPDHDEESGNSQVICQVYGGAGGTVEEDHLIAELIRSAPESRAALREVEAELERKKCEIVFLKLRIDELNEHNA